MKKIIIFLLVQLSLGLPVLAAADFSSASRESFEAEFTDPFDPPAAADLHDPLEPVNRAAFWVNDKIYTHVLTPACNAVSPRFRAWAGKWLARLGDPLQIGPAELEFKFRDAGSEAGRFLLHGLLGLIDRVDPGKTAGLSGGDEDFGQVMEAFGIGPGIYLVLPVLGPSSLREGVGGIASFYLDPSPSFLNIRGDCRILGRQRDLLGDLHAYASIRNSTLDPYLSIRNAYTQQQASEDGERVMSQRERGASGAGVHLVQQRGFPATTLQPAEAARYL
jgi:phospholipid-binding lipoprotein MlaA